MSRKLRKVVLSRVWVLIAIVFFSSIIAPEYIHTGSSPSRTTATTLNIALYPFVPRLDQFKQATSDAWAKVQPDVTLNYVDWDCYSQDPPKDLDVFVFDGIFLDYFASKGHLASLKPGDIEGLSDFLGYAVNDSKVNDVYYGIPQLGCGNLLFYRQGDKALARANSLGDVYSAIGKCSDPSIPPPKGENLLVDLSGGTTDSCLYLETVQDINNMYTPNPPLPPADKLDKQAVTNLQRLVSSGCKEQVSYSSANAYQRAAWFGAGLGRAAVGFTESISAMGNGRKTVAFKLMPLANKNDVHLFYIDLVGINASITDPERKSLALKLANLAASSNVLVASIGPTPKDDYPQYLMPVRQSIFLALGRDDPIYQRMYDIVSTSHPHMFRIGPNSRQWLNTNKSAIRQTILNAPMSKAKTAR